jgi:hypothetical protein
VEIVPREKTESRLFKVEEKWDSLKSPGGGKWESFFAFSLFSGSGWI